MVSHPPARFGDYKHSGSEDIMILVFEDFKRLLKSASTIYL